MLHDSFVLVVDLRVAVASSGPSAGETLSFSSSYIKTEDV